MKIKWVNAHGEATGYGQVSAGLTKAIVDLGHEVVTKGEDVVIWHDLPDERAPEKIDYIYTMFEFMPPPPEWETVLNRAKAIFTGSTYSAACLKMVTEKPVIPVGHGVSVVPKKPRKEFNVPTFLTIAEHVPRKFLEQIIGTFEDEFAKEDVELHVKTWNPLINVARLFMGKKKSALLCGFFQDLGSVYTSYDGYILPSVEGWGMTQMEAIACGLKPITLGFGGTLDFCNDQNSYIVEPGPIEQIELHHWFPIGQPGMMWRRPTEKSLREKMRLAFEKREKLPDDYCSAFREIWSWKTVAKQMISEIEQHERV